MPDGPLLVLALVRVGRRVINVAKLILSEDHGKAGVDVTLETGVTFRLAGPEAGEWRQKLAPFVPADPGEFQRAPTRAVRGRPDQGEARR